MENSKKNESYIERYITNSEKIEVIIRFQIKLPSRVNNFNIKEHPLYTRQDDGTITVNYHKNIPKNLFEDIKLGFTAFINKEKIPESYTQRNPSQYIVGYIREILPKINKEILQRKYNEGHIILRTISIFDVEGIFLLKTNEQPQAIIWPLALPEFPNINKDKPYPDTFIKDYIDAMTEYFYYDLNECIRKIITSLENYFIHYNLKINKRQNFFQKLFKTNAKFKNLINTYITPEYYSIKNEKHLKILRDNILFIYGLRCSIVHDKLRLNIDNLIICKKAIGTLSYIYQSKFINEDKKYEYIFSFVMQFQMLSSTLGVNLDDLEKIEKNTKNDEKNIIKDGKELDDYMFSNLQITKEEKKKCRK